MTGFDLPTTLNSLQVTDKSGSQPSEILSLHEI